MNEVIEYQVYWNEADLRIVARYRKKPALRIGEVNGQVTGGGVAFLADVKVNEEVELVGGFFGLFKRKVKMRGMGIGSELIERFEHEMGTHEVEEIRGNLVPEVPAKLEWLIEWYRKRGYEFHSGETTGDWSPPQTAGVISKGIPLRSPYESRVFGKIILDGGPGEP